MSREQLDHWAEVQQQYIGAELFLTFVWEKYRLELDYSSANPGTPLDRVRLLDECFFVDRAKLDNERRELLDSLATTTSPEVTQ